MENKWIKVIVGIVAIFVIIAGSVALWGTSDLRTETATTNPQAQKAEALVREMGVAHGIENWDTIQAYQAHFEDEFLGFIGQNSAPFKESQVSLDLQYIPGTFDGRLRFLSGADKGKAWGIQSWNTYIQNENGPIESVKDQNVYFWLPTYQYFLEFPKRIQEANAFAYAGETMIDGKSCEGVLASWNTTEPQRDIDQYLIWIDKDTKRIVKLEYTIREMFNFLTGGVLFKDYKSYGGILFPGRLPVESNLQKEGLLHEMRILDFKPNVVDPASLRPLSEIPVSGGGKES